MSRSIELNLIAMDIQKDIVYTVEEGTSLEDVSEELAKLYRDCDKNSFTYRKSDNPSELALPKETTIGFITPEHENELILYVSYKPKKSDVCCVIY